MLKKITILSCCLISQGCITTQLSESEMIKYKGKHVSEFLSEQRFYNIHDKNHNFFTGKGSSDKYFLYSPALYVEDQVKAPAINVQRLCKISGGKWVYQKYDGSTEIESALKANESLNEMGFYAFLRSYRDFKNSYINYQKQSIAYRYQTEALYSYINKGYFYNEFTCVIDGVEKWSLSIIPVEINKDTSGVDQLWVLMIVNK